VTQQAAEIQAEQRPTRQRLIDAAMRLFLEKGYEATGIAAILQEAGVHSGSLYYFFKSKEDLLIGVLEHYLELLRPVILEPAESRTDDPIERVFALLALYREFLEQTGCRHGCPIGNLALEVSDHHERARELIRRNFDNWCAGVRQWLESAGDRLPPGLDREALARFILTVMEGAQMQAKAQKTLAAYDASIAQLRHYFDCLQQTPRREKRT
jgi:AcrR family transcriptional regulator